MNDVITKTVLAIDAPHFFCGVVLHDDRVVIAAPIVKKWALGKTRAEVERHCAKMRWKVREL